MPPPGQSDMLAGDRQVLGHLHFYNDIALSAAEIAAAKHMKMPEVLARLRRLRRHGFVRFFPGESKRPGLWQATTLGHREIQR
jgi:hypothetical protein